MRVLFTTTPGWGHVHPLVPLAHAFVERGDDVLWAAPPDFVAMLGQSGFEVRRAGLAFRDRQPTIDPKELAKLPDRDRSALLFLRVFGAMFTGPMLDDLLPIVDSFRPAVIVHEAAEFAAAIAAAKAGIPSVNHSLGGLMPAERLTQVSEQVAGLWRSHGLQPQPFGGSYEHLYLDIYPPSLPNNDNSHLPAIQSLRPVAFASRGDGEAPAWSAADGSEPLIYITFGTAPTVGTSPVVTVVNALRDLPVRIVVTVGPGGDPAMLGDQPHNVQVARYIPQTELLGSCSVVVSHAGSGTFLASLAHGLPQLCLPRAADQFLNAASCVRSGAGFALNPGEDTAAAIREAVRRLLEDPAPRAAAAKLSREIAAMPSPAEVSEILGERFASIA